MRKQILFRSLVLFASALGAAASVAVAGINDLARVPGTPQEKSPIPKKGPDVQYVPTPQDVVEELLKLADVKKDDVVYDLGCGDGRIVITAAKRYGARGVGIDIDPERIRESKEKAEKEGVADRVRFREEDLFESDIKEATVVTLYLLNSLNQKLKPKLLKDLKPGTRVVSHNFDMGEWKPEKTVQLLGSTIYLWVIPANHQPAN
ncbi:MAG: methyltransferase domain-containing protein [Acidobacteria bacterium]|nr:methyltransferase domain-containing protein [Acidobacteriota bacterium]